ncbi:LPXTG cell wall anchor domain-containing protein [Streptacidiphilus neutrinimicus]|uniref:LPXTG cell wall anchor domain-containing protein n=1 Tax=Streptacidiphilus neutrinimicus TaxID=105420 RepID=UPI0005A80E16|nr:LPXTG cell wall anchor domain-containing protein [Streptacidiphilus neutrinimicus]
MGHGITRRAAVGLVAAGMATAAAVTPAHAATVPVNYNCQTPIGAKSAVSQVEISATPSGSSYAVTVTFTNGVSSSPVPLGAGSMTPSVVVAVGGADDGGFTATGPANAQQIPANSPIRIGSMTGTYAPHHTGSVTLTPSTLTIKALGTTTTCKPSGAVSPALTLNVTTASGLGAASGSSSTSSGAGAATGGTLPQTGPADDAAAFGLFGGTVLLAGVAGALWLTRRGRSGRLDARL